MNADQLKECREAFEKSEWVLFENQAPDLTREDDGYLQERVNDDWIVWQSAWSTRFPSPQPVVSREDGELRQQILDECNRASVDKTIDGATAAWRIWKLIEADRLNRLPAPQSPQIEECGWTHDEWSESWSAGCGAEWIFPDGGPAENDMKFCPSCGKPVALATLKAVQG